MKKKEQLTARTYRTTEKQNLKVIKEARRRSRLAQEKVSESQVIRTLIDEHL